MSQVPPQVEPAEVRCAECGTQFWDGQDRVSADDRTFCRPCYQALTEQLRQVVVLQGADVNYPLALVGALVGAAAGVLLWWGFTVVTHVQLGLVAVAIGYGAGKGAVLAVGGKRARGLQITAAGIATLAYFYANYLVARTLILRHYVEQGQEVALPWLPNLGLFFQVVRVGFNAFDLVFLAIVVYQAWSLPAPLKLASRG